jgi:hypothetical protein
MLGWRIGVGLSAPYSSTLDKTRGMNAPRVERARPPFGRGRLPTRSAAWRRRERPRRCGDIKSPLLGGVRCGDIKSPLLSGVGFGFVAAVAVLLLQLVGDAIDEGFPARFDDVLADAHGAPGIVAAVPRLSFLLQVGDDRLEGFVLVTVLAKLLPVQQTRNVDLGGGVIG